MDREAEHQGGKRHDGLCGRPGSGDRPPRQRGRLTYSTLKRQFQDERQQPCEHLR